MADMMCFFWYSQFNEILDCDAAMTEHIPAAERDWKHCWQSTGQQSKAASNILITDGFENVRMN
jgi:hypothetical protein